MYTYAKLTGKMAHNIFRDITRFSSWLIIFDKRFGIWTLIDALFARVRQSRRASLRFKSRAVYSQYRCNFPYRQSMSSELHVYQLQLDYLRSTKYDITASLRAYVRARVEANCVTGYVSLAKLDCLKSSKRESTPCRLYVSVSDPASNNFFFSFYSFFSFLFYLSLLLLFLLLRGRIARILVRKLHRKFCLRAACLLARDSSNQWIFSEKYSHAVPIKGFPTGV